MSTEIPVENMSEAELDAELRSYGIDPEQLVQNMISKLAELCRKQAARISELESGTKLPVTDDSSSNRQDCTAIGDLFPHRYRPARDSDVCFAVIAARAGSEGANGNDH